MISWRIHTERKNIDSIISATKAAFPCQGVSLTSGLGLWGNILEESLTIEIVGVALDEFRVKKLAEDIRFFNKQEAVLVTAIDLIDHKLIS